MPRPPKFDEAQIIASARDLIAARGPEAASIGAIARAIHAPTGSIYHRFESRDVLLGEVWLSAAEAFQNAYFAVLRGPDARDAGLAAALYLAQRVRANLAEARVLQLHSRQAFVGRGWPAGMERRARQLGHQIDAELRAFSQRLCERIDARTLRTVTYAVLDAPFAAVRRHVAAREAPPEYVDLLITATYDAILALLGIPRRRNAPQRARME
jgi:AcrR family transcriptional regulator